VCEDHTKSVTIMCWRAQRNSIPSRIYQSAEMLGCASIFESSAFAAIMWLASHVHNLIRMYQFHLLKGFGHKGLSVQRTLQGESGFLGSCSAAGLRWLREEVAVLGAACNTDVLGKHFLALEVFSPSPEENCFCVHILKFPTCLQRGQS
jgi:hypothetical protein